MSKIKIVNTKGASVGDADIPDSLLDTKRGAQAVVDTVVAHRAAVRGGNASTLRKGEVAGSNKRPWRQKGTGRARAGFRQSPVWRGGSVAFGPHPREYDKKVNRQVVRLALRRVFSDLVKEGAVTVLDQMILDQPKTKAFLGIVKTLKVGSPVLFVLQAIEKNMRLASRNLQGVEIISASQVDVYTMMRYPKVVVDKAGLDTLLKRMGQSKGGKQ
jgi:large subunit ribosomal protein L4